MPQTLFEQALATVRQLPLRERARLVAVVVEELAMQPVADAALTQQGLPFPVITEGQWSDDIPTSRAELYDDDERC